MNENVFQINEKTWRIENGMVRIFLLAGEDKALLVDTGMTLHGVKALAEELCGMPVELINTHGDPDHIGANDEFERLYIHPAEEENYRSAGGKGELVFVEDGDVLELGGRPIEIVHLPGHTPGSIGLLDVNANVLISGDPIQDGSIFMFGPGRDLTQYVSGLARLEEKYSGRFTELWPAHGTFPVYPELIPQLRAGALRVLAGEVESTPHDFHGNALRRCDVGCAAFLLPV